jgi:3-deoxy-manno-octulosonate cytidylyltransferase (CMP-KDO synthetase)
LPIAGKPMIVHVCERALEAGADEVIVAVDDERIADAVGRLPVTAMLTSRDHSSGTERLLEVADRLAWRDDERVVNLQGDEPLIDPGLIGRLAAALAAPARAEVATLAAPIIGCDEIFDPNAVKVVVDQANHALYFSRAPVPWYRDGFSSEPPAPVADFHHLRHIGLYAYTAGFLRRYACWPRSRLEDVECLEQLRILWHGERIQVLTVDAAPGAGVDTEADLRRVERVLTASTGSPKPGV